MITKTLFALLTAGALLAGCAGPTTLTAEVSSFGEWPADRKAGTYAFDRLPSQQALGAETDRIEAAARNALGKAGFTPVAAGQTPDVLVQVGATTTLSDVQPWDDPLWWRGGFGYYRRSPWIGPPGWGAYGMYPAYGRPRYDRQVAVLLRDQANGKPLYEARASSESGSPPSMAVLGALFDAALVDFPRLGVNPRKVVVALPGTSTATP